MMILLLKYGHLLHSYEVLVTFLLLYKTLTKATYREKIYLGLMVSEGQLETLMAYGFRGLVRVFNGQAEMGGSK